MYKDPISPPGPGTWLLDALHFPKPMSPWHIENYGEAFGKAYMEGATRYGLVTCVDFKPINGFWYLNVRGIVDLTPTDRPGPEITQRREVAKAAFAEKRWRKEVEAWQSLKPNLVCDHKALQNVPIASLDDKGLLDHLTRCYQHVTKMLATHHTYNMANMIPVGDYLAAAIEWTGLPKSDILAALRGASPMSSGASEELSALVKAFAQDAAAAKVLGENDSPGTIVERLLRAKGAVGKAFTQYLDSVGHRLVDGSDFTERTIRECPEVLLAACRATLEGRTTADNQEQSEAAMEHVRSAVPTAQRQAFDDLWQEARHVYHLRDERGLFCDIWAWGIARAAVLEAGQRLAKKGLLQKAEHFLEANFSEMQQLVRGAKATSGDELAERATYRAAHSFMLMPPFLGPPPGPPPPMQWLGPEIGRAERAMQTTIMNMFEMAQKGAEATANVLKGLAASPGVYEGRACVIHSTTDLSRVRRGDILIANTTTEAFNSVVPIIGGIITDCGGLLSHAAIVARESGIPAVVGTGEATRAIPDGARLLVDGSAGEVRILP